jgi:hypothetical protein
MWSCNGSASPAVFPEARVLLTVTLWAAANERYVLDCEGLWDGRFDDGRAAGFGVRGAATAATLPEWSGSALLVAPAPAATSFASP